MTDSIAGFFSNTGGGMYWPKGSSSPHPTPIGEEIEGIIVAVHPPEPQTDLKTREPIPGKFQIRIDLQTELRDPEATDDDGKRTLYVKGWMTGAIADALKKANTEEPALGAKLKVKLTGTAAPMRPGIEGAKQFSAVYTPSGNFFAGNGAGAQVVKTEQADAAIPADPPAGIDAAAWQSMPLPAKQAIANTMAGLSK
jgi:hypothetical protein